MLHVRGIVASGIGLDGHATQNEMPVMPSIHALTCYHHHHHHRRLIETIKPNYKFLSSTAAAAVPPTPNTLEDNRPIDRPSASSGARVQCLIVQQSVMHTIVACRLTTSETNFEY